MNPFSYWTSIPTVALFMSLRWIRKETLGGQPGAWDTAEGILLLLIGLAAAFAGYATLMYGYIAWMYIFPPADSGNPVPAFWFLFLEFARQRVETKRRSVGLVHG